MAMDFFQHQERARKRTGLLLAYFFLALGLTVLAVNAAFWLLFAVSGLGPGIGFGAWLASEASAYISIATMAVVGGGSLVRYLQLRSGGHVVAESVGAERVPTATENLQERTLLNIVEEMAIASGTPAPTVYVMRDEPGINAFVAGFEPTEAVLVVTQGALDAFTRDEMQGVVGHEFSHILNGDMRMNVRLYAMLAGILMIGRVGEFLLRGNRRGSVRVGGKREGGAVIALGVALTVIGYVGLFFGRLIKAAISRQRELLADASSVQFTRNPQGIGEALLKINDAQHGSLLANARAEDMSHMCIALPVQLNFFAGLLATHPPLEARINAIDPALLARGRARARMRAAQATAAAATPPGTASFAADATDSPVPQAMQAAHAALAAPALAASVGQPTPDNLALATRLYESIPTEVRELLRTGDGARAVIYGLVLTDTDPQQHDAGLALVAQGDGSVAADRLRGAMPALQRLGARLRLPALDLALPALRALDESGRQVFLEVLRQLVRLDRRFTVREYVVLSLMEKYLKPGAGKLKPVRHRSYGAVGGEINAVISLLCHAAGGDDAGRNDLHGRVMRGFGVGSPALLPMNALGAGILSGALGELSGLSPLLKKPLLDACIDCVTHDNRLQVAEIELVRAIGEALDCPVPPFAGRAA